MQQSGFYTPANNVRVEDIPTHISPSPYPSIAQIAPGMMYQHPYKSPVIPQYPGYQYMMPAQGVPAYLPHPPAQFICGNPSLSTCSIHGHVPIPHQLPGTTAATSESTDRPQTVAHIGQCKTQKLSSQKISIEPEKKHHVEVDSPTIPCTINFTMPSTRRDAYSSDMTLMDSYSGVGSDAKDEGSSVDEYESVEESCSSSSSFFSGIPRDEKTLAHFPTVRPRPVRSLAPCILTSFTAVHTPTRDRKGDRIGWSCELQSLALHGSAEPEEHSHVVQPPVIPRLDLGTIENDRIRMDRQTPLWTSTSNNSWISSIYHVPHSTSVGSVSSNGKKGKRSHVE